MYAALALMWLPHELLILPALNSPIHSFHQQHTNELLLQCYWVKQLPTITTDILRNVFKFYPHLQPKNNPQPSSAYKHTATKFTTAGPNPVIVRETIPLD